MMGAQEGGFKRECGISVSGGRENGEGQEKGLSEG